MYLSCPLWVCKASQVLIPCHIAPSPLSAKGCSIHFIAHTLELPLILLFPLFHRLSSEPVGSTLHTQRHTISYPSFQPHAFSFAKPWGIGSHLLPMFTFFSFILKLQWFLQNIFNYIIPRSEYSNGELSILTTVLALLSKIGLQFESVWFIVVEKVGPRTRVLYPQSESEEVKACAWLSLPCFFLFNLEP